MRVDTAIEEGGAILPAYDSLIAKLVVWGRDRDEALARMARALNEFLVQGVPTTVPFHSRVIANPVFRAGEATTAFLSENPDVIPATSDFVAVNAESVSESGPMREVLVEVDGRRLTVRLPADLAVGGGDGGAAPRRAVAKPAASKSTPAATKATGPQLMSPLQGTIVRIPVAVGQAVAVGELVCVVEAMKMENEIVAHRAGVVSRIPVAAGEAVKIGAELMTIDSPPG